MRNRLVDVKNKLMVARGGGVRRTSEKGKAE